MNKQHTKPLRVIYIAGPFRGKNAWEIENNIRRAEEVAFKVWEAGFVAVCPHANTRYFNGALPDTVWLPGYIDLLLRCDAVVMVPGFARSSGAMKELQTAVDNNIPVFMNVQGLIIYSDKRLNVNQGDFNGLQRRKE